MLSELKTKRETIQISENRGGRYFHDEAFVFSNDDGYPYLRGKILEKMERILKKTVLSRRVTPHALHHTHISMLTEAGVDLRTIMERGGHDAAKTTLEIYTHVTNKKMLKIK